MDDTRKTALANAARQKRYRDGVLTEAEVGRGRHLAVDRQHPAAQGRGDIQSTPATAW
jgi:hypothetical protein